MPTMTPVATEIQPPNMANGLGMFSKVLGLQQQELGIGIQRQELAAQTANTQQTQERNQELQQAQQLALSVKGGAYRNPDGSLNRLKLADDLSALGPYAQSMASSYLSQANEMVANEQAHQNLSASQQQQLSATFGSLASKPGVSKSDVIDAVNALVQENPQEGRMALSMMAHLPQNASSQQLQGLMRQWAMAGTSAQAGVAQTAPAMAAVQGPHGLEFAQTNPLSPLGMGPQGAPISQGVAPTIVTNPTTGAPTVINPQATGSAGAFGGVPQSNASPAYPRGNTMSPYPGEQQDIAGFQKYVAQTRQEGDQAPLMHNINQNILKLSESAKTGPGSPIWQHVIGALGAPFGLSPTANYQEVTKFLEKNALANMQAMGGPPSDARLSAAVAANGGNEFSPQALQYVTRFNDATTRALEMYREGLDKAVGTVGPNYLATPQFRAEWAKNFDIRLFELQEADPAQQQHILKGLSPAQRKELSQKWLNLKKLSSMGAMQ